MKKIKKYLALTRAGILDAMQYRMSLVVMFFGNILYLILIYFLWKSIYASAGTDVVNGMTFEMTMVYLVLATALFNFMEMYTVWEVGRKIQSGEIVLCLLRPMKYKKFLFWSFTGNMLINFIGTFLPTMIIVTVVTKGEVKIGINLLYFAVAVILGIIINYNIDFIISTVCLFTESIWGINIMKQVIVAFLSGATIPLAFFPDKLEKVVNLLPFRAIYDTPLTLLMDDGSDITAVLSKLGFSLAWTIAISVISSLFWNSSIKQVTVNGG